MLREIRRAIPPKLLPVLGLFYVIIKFTESLIRFCYRIDPNHLPAVEGGRYTQFCVITFVAIGFIAMFYGVARGKYFHPASDLSTSRQQRLRFPDYLQTTPWNSSKRLPWGSPLLSWVDIVIVGCMVFLAAIEVPEPFTTSQGCAIIVAAFALGYGLSAATFNQSPHGETLRVASLFLMPTIVLATLLPTMLVILAAVILALAHLSQRESLRVFPLWEGDKKQRPALGWTFDALSPHIKDNWLSRSRSWTIVAWVAWTSTIVMIASEMYGDWNFVNGDVAMFVLIIGGFAALIRLCVYVRGVVVYFRTRFKTRRWIVPETDNMFVPVLAIMILTLLSAGLILQDLLPSNIVLPIWVTSVTAASLLIGPTPQKWLLTSQGALYYFNKAKIRKQPTPGA